MVCYKIRIDLLVPDGVTIGEERAYGAHKMFDCLFRIASKGELIYGGERLMVTCRVDGSSLYIFFFSERKSRNSVSSKIYLIRFFCSSFLF